MNKEFIPYEEALTLKQLGFDEPCFRFYFEKYAIDSKTGGYIKTGEFYLTDIPKTKTIRCSAPLYQQAFRWFREKKLCDGSVCRHGDADGGYSYCWEILCEYGVYEHRHFKLGYETYEEAELACLDKLIEIVQGGNK